MPTATKPVISSSVAASFPAEPASATSARRFVTNFLKPLVREDLVHVAALLTTELATNSVLHARTPIDVEVSVSAREVLVHVTDLHPSGPRRVHADDHSTFGRGLVLVEHLSDRWGVTPRLPGKAVWFSLAR